MTTASHLGSLTLRRAFAGEQLDETAQQHLAACPECRTRLDGLKTEQQQFEAAIPFERFAEGVERAAQRAHTPPRRTRWTPALVALAAVLVAFVTVRLSATSQGTTHLKGGANIELVVSAGPNGPQRVASENPSIPEPLATAERVRIGVTPSSWHFALVLSIDATGTVTPVYSAGNRSLPLTGASPEFLPDSLEFTGQGLEHVVVILSDRALETDVVAHELRRAFNDAHQDLTRIDHLDVPGEQFHRTFLKP